ncbi:MAG: hypothetical protein JWN72_665, partial [Thermoleophilia bacterium]|nr:hypothetical protein [Thermoleophilia bacterium]
SGAEQCVQAGIHLYNTTGFNGDRSLREAEGLMPPRR